MRTALVLILALTLGSLEAQQRSVLPRNIGGIPGKVVRETPHFLIYAERSYVPVDLDWLQKEVETIYPYVAERMGVSTTERFALTFRPPDTASCPKRGLAEVFDPVGQAIIFADQRTSRAQISGVLAHELAHLLHYRAIKAGTGDVNLTEGLASWATGKYWHAWQGAPEDNVRSIRREGRYTSLEESYRKADSETNTATCLRNRDARYNTWAAFIEFLIAEYGMDRFRQLLATREIVRVGQASPSSLSAPVGGGSFGFNSVPGVLPPITDYKGVYGLFLTELEEAWLEKLEAPR